MPIERRHNTLIEYWFRSGRRLGWLDVSMRTVSTASKTIATVGTASKIIATVGTASKTIAVTAMLLFAVSLYTP